MDSTILIVPLLLIAGSAWGFAMVAWLRCFRLRPKGVFTIPLFSRNPALITPE